MSNCLSKTHCYYKSDKFDCTKPLKSCNYIKKEDIGLEFINVKKPKFCVCDTCNPIVNMCNDEGLIKHGGSVICMGENKVTEIWKSVDKEHVNDICYCIYSPFKGWIKNVMCNDDFSVISIMIREFAKVTKRPISHM